MKLAVETPLEVDFESVVAAMAVLGDYEVCEKSNNSTQSMVVKVYSISAVELKVPFIMLKEQKRY